MSETLLATGSFGRIDSEVCVYFAREFGYSVHGAANNPRAKPASAHSDCFCFRS